MTQNLTAAAMAVINSLIATFGHAIENDEEIDGGDDDPSIMRWSESRLAQGA